MKTCPVWNRVSLLSGISLFKHHFCIILKCEPGRWTHPLLSDSPLETFCVNVLSRSCCELPDIQCDSFGTRPKKMRISQRLVLLCNFSSSVTLPFPPTLSHHHSVTCRKRKPRKSRPDPNTTPDLSCAHPTAYLSFNTSSILLNGKLLFFCQRNISRHDGNTFTSHLPQTK